jgi:thiamine-monophosphate kinase
LNGGEDYELLFTIAQSDYEKIKGSPHFTIIGHMTEETTGCRLITKSNEMVALRAQGWQAFEG